MSQGLPHPAAQELLLTVPCHVQHDSLAYACDPHACYWLYAYADDLEPSLIVYQNKKL